MGGQIRGGQRTASLRALLCALGKESPNNPGSRSPSAVRKIEHLNNKNISCNYMMSDASPCEMVRQAFALSAPPTRQPGVFHVVRNSIIFLVKRSRNYSESKSWSCYSDGSRLPKRVIPVSRDYLT
jgi:hypothetical protein